MQLTEDEQLIVNTLKANNGKASRTLLRRVLTGSTPTVDLYTSLYRKGLISYINRELAIVLNETPLNIDPNEDTLGYVMNWLNNDHFCHRGVLVGNYYLLTDEDNTHCVYNANQDIDAQVPLFISNDKRACICFILDKDHVMRGKG